MFYALNVLGHLKGGHLKESFTNKMWAICLSFVYNRRCIVTINCINVYIYMKLTYIIMHAWSNDPVHCLMRQSTTPAVYDLATSNIPIITSLKQICCSGNNFWVVPTLVLK